MQCNVLIKIKAAGNDIVSCTGMLGQQDSKGPMLHDRRCISSLKLFGNQLINLTESNNNKMILLNLDR